MKVFRKPSLPNELVLSNSSEGDSVMMIQERGPPLSRVSDEQPHPGPELVGFKGSFAGSGSCWALVSFTEPR